MYDPGDTIVAVSSADGGGRVIVRVCGRRARGACGELFEGDSDSDLDCAGVYPGVISPADGVAVQGWAYVFLGPHSYTGEDVVELHFAGSSAISNALLAALLDGGEARAAGPGEFTARAYLNGKMDIAQAEAVGELIAGSNRFQLSAAERLLSGRLSAAAAGARDAMMDCLSLIEAGLDFSEEDIEFISRADAAERLGAIKVGLEELLSGSIRCESLISLASVGIAGAPNAGKSSLLNRLLGEDRSIVSDQRKTTRDVLTGELTLAHSRCVLFDCAGLLGQVETIMDELAQAAAVEAIGHASAVLFCVDLSKSDWVEDAEVGRLVEAERVIGVGTKADLVDEAEVADRCARLAEMFGFAFTAASAVSGAGMETLKGLADDAVVASTMPSGGGSAIIEGRCDVVGLTQRHRRAVVEAIEAIDGAIGELEGGGGEEVVSMMIRSACQSLAAIEQPGGGAIDEEVLERIFGRFCIGK